MRFPQKSRNWICGRLEYFYTRCETKIVFSVFSDFPGGGETSYDVLLDFYVKYLKKIFGLKKSNLKNFPFMKSILNLKARKNIQKRLEILMRHFQILNFIQNSSISLGARPCAGHTHILLQTFFVSYFLSLLLKLIHFHQNFDFEFTCFTYFLSYRCSKIKMRLKSS